MKLSSFMLLAKLGYLITAVTSKIDDTNYLQQLGASHFIDSKMLSGAGKPLQKEQWTAAIDVLGSHVLVNICVQVQYGGIVVACGLAQGLDFPSTVTPFILKGITLARIDSVMASYQKRITTWNFLATHLDDQQLNHITNIISLDEYQIVAENMVTGKLKGGLLSM